MLGESVVVVANGLNRAAIAAWRADHPPIGDSDFLLVADASETLETFMVAGKPDPMLFETTIGSILEWAARGGRTVRVFGEMVAVLWDAGNVAGALALETLWNDMASNRQFFLLCAYPEVLLAEAPLGDVNAMCERHSDCSSLGQMPQFAAATYSNAIVLSAAPDACPQAPCLRPVSLREGHSSTGSYLTSLRTATSSPRSWPPTPCSTLSRPSA